MIVETCMIINLMYVSDFWVGNFEVAINYEEFIAIVNNM